MSVDVVAMGRLSAGMLIWQRAGGSAACTLVCKATFSLQPGVSPLCDEPQPLFETDRYWNNDSRCSLAEASDMVPAKQRADVLLVGDAVAPGGMAARSWTTRLAVGSLDKRIDVFCDRHWDANGVLLAGPGIERIPLHWERTAGGRGSDNPPGWHHSSARDDRGNLRAPNLQSHGSMMQRPDDTLLPAGYGPLAPHWPPRAAYLHGGTGWSHERWAEFPMPQNFDFSYFNAAPRDQQLDNLSGNEELVLENLIAGRAALTTRLAPIQPVFSVQGTGAPRVLTPRCDTLWIDTHAARCTLTWRVTIDAPYAAEALMVLACEDATLARTPLEDEGSATVAVSSAIAVAAQEPYPLASGVSTSTAPSKSLAQLREQTGGEASWSGAADQTLYDDRIPAPAAGDEPTAIASSVAAPPAAAAENTRWLQFDQAAATASEQGPAFPLATPGGIRASGQHLDDIRDEGDAVHWSGPTAQTMHAGQMTGDIAAVVADLEAKHRAAPEPVPIFSGSTPAASGASAAALPPVLAPTVNAPVAPAPVGLLPTPTTAAEAPGPLAATAQLATTSAAPASSGYGYIEEPSLIGPLATPELRAHHDEAAAEPTPAPAEPENAAAPAPEDEPTAQELEQVPLPLDDYPLERCAAITAALHCRPAKRADILDQHQLTPDLWQRLRGHYDSELTGALQRGKLTLMQTHDKAYYDQLETERGPITLDEYARLRVSAERGIRPTTMSELKLPQPSLMPVERVWLRKTTSDMRMVERLDDAVEAARSV